MRAILLGADRNTVVDRRHPGQRVGVFTQKLRQPDHAVAALIARHLRPNRRGAPGGGNGEIDFLSPRQRDFAGGPAGGGIDMPVGATGSAFDMAAVNQQGAARQDGEVGISNHVALRYENSGAAAGSGACLAVGLFCGMSSYILSAPPLK